MDHSKFQPSTSPLQKLFFTLNIYTYIILNKLFFTLNIYTYVLLNKLFYTYIKIIFENGSCWTEKTENEINGSKKNGREITANKFA